ncbi:MAG TPA: cell envelope biogenesis protein TolA, partial [Allosphingosinicella sp.]|nr:cell envelope biogenesis protein TolA [Allosphingosinicella sp.]
MDRAEAAGLGVATAGHLALLAALTFGFAATRLPVTATAPIEVSFVDEVGLESKAPSPSTVEPAPLAGPQDMPPEPAMPAPPRIQQVPRPETQPQPTAPAP